jgi:serine/threonine-protein kinase
LALNPGTRLGPYEITALLGVGGMGEVYRATDTNLKRQVAIKVLPAAVAGDAERLARFQREAEVLAALNHPNIAHVYGLEKSDGTGALVMELVEGPTLADRIAKGPIPLDEALPIAKQIAEALEAAHEPGIIHRDLKPANIKVRDDGTAKVLDFGLAKALEPTGAMSATVSILPTITSPAMTQAGLILGTAAYMSPEQAVGKSVDKRSDLWAFGVVLLEMLTGRQVFQGETVSHVLASVLKDEPDWAALPASTPGQIRQLLRRCLEKNPRSRLRDIGEARVLIEDLLAGKFALIDPATSVPQASRWAAWGMAGVAAVVSAIVTGVVVWHARPAGGPASIKRFTITLPQGEIFSSATRRFVAVSPDATRLVYGANGQLYLHAMDQFASTPIAGTSGATSPFFSRDSQWVGFYQAGQLKKVSITGGAPLALCAATLSPFGVSWEPDGTILFGQGSAGISRVPDGGGVPSVVITVNKEKGEVAYGPELLPDGKTILFAVASPTSGQQAGSTGWDDAQIVTQAIDSTKRTVVGRGSEAHYLPSGHLVYLSRGVLFARPFDARRGISTGSPVSMIDGVRSQTSGGVGAGGLANITGAGEFALSTNGLLAYIESPAALGTDGRVLAWVDRQGHESLLPGLPPRPYAYPKISPDGKRLALDIRDQDQDIWTFDFEGGQRLAKLTFDKAPELRPIWTPDGHRIVFFRNGQGLFWQSSDGAGAPEPLTTSGTDLQAPLAFTKEGNDLIYQEQTPASVAFRIKMLNLVGRGVVDVLTEGDLTQQNAALSPDGRWLAYEAAPVNSPDSTEIFVRPFPNVQSGGKWQISSKGGTRPVWSRNGRELFYLVRPQGAETSATTMMAVPIGTTPTLQPGNPSKLFSGNYFVGLIGITYDVAPDGRFLMVKRSPTDVADASRILVVENWFEELKARVPTK